MCNPACIRFIENNFVEVKDKTVIEVGSRNVNGSARASIEKLYPKSYLGIDITPGDGVDEICSIHDLINTYGRNNFDIVICTEVLEHIEDWKRAIHNLKGIISPGGILLLTTVTKGFKYHGHPYDYWRYSLDDLANIFADLNRIIIEENNTRNSIYAKFQKPKLFKEVYPLNYELYSILKERRTKDPNNWDELLIYPYHRMKLILKRKLRKVIIWILPRRIKNLLK